MRQKLSPANLSAVRLGKSKGRTVVIVKLTNAAVASARSNARVKSPAVPIAPEGSPTVTMTWPSDVAGPTGSLAVSSTS